MHAKVKLIAGNWKMNGGLADARLLAGAVAAHAKGKNADVLICPPFIHIETAVKAGKGRIYVGGQDCHARAFGAFTGSIAPEMLKDAGCSYVLTGHSERRSLCHEKDKTVAEKSAAAVRAGVTPVICVGEQETSRDTGDHIAVVLSQVKNSLPADVAAEQIALAYEPVWAIGTGKTASLDDVAEMHDAMRGVLVEKFGDAGHAVRILYGGSVKPGNAYDILSLENVGGVLVGGASLKADDFNAIIDAGVKAAEKG